MLSDAEILPSVREWLSTADDMDLLTTIQTLTDLLEALDPTWADAPEIRSRLELFGESGPATRVRPTPAEFDASAKLSDESVIQASRAAGAGDDRAYRYLQGAVREFSQIGNVPWLLSYVTALAAERRDDHAIADPLWTRLVHQESIVTPITLPRGVSAAVASREGTRRQQSTLLRRQAVSFDVLAMPLSADPEPVLLTAELLRRRHDAAGAALLLYAVVRRHGVGALPQIEAALADLGVSPSGSRSPAGRSSVLRTRADRSIRRRIARRDASEWRVNAVIHMVMAAASAFALGVATAGVYTDAHPNASAALITAAWLAGVFALPILAARAASRYLYRHPEFLRSRPKAKPARRVPPCQCLTSRIIRGEVTLDYAELHLQSVQLSSTASRAGAVRVCPDTAIAWLVLTGRSTTAALLLRGAAPQEPQVEQATSTGMYL